MLVLLPVGNQMKSALDYLCFSIPDDLTASLVNVVIVCTASTHKYLYRHKGKDAFSLACVRSLHCCVHGEAMVEPESLAEQFLRLGLDPGIEVLDVACGTGVVGAELKQAGYTNVDGLDPCQGYLTGAMAKGIFRKVYRAYIGILD